MVVGQEMEGDENYHVYQQCVEAVWRKKIRSYVLIKQLLAAGEPNINPSITFRAIEESLENVVNTVERIRV